MYKLCFIIGQCRTASQSTPADPRTRRNQGAPLDAPAKQIKHDRYLSHGRARPNARRIYAHTWFPGAPDVGRLPQSTGSAAGGARLRQALQGQGRLASDLKGQKLKVDMVFSILQLDNCRRSSESSRSISLSSLSHLT